MADAQPRAIDYVGLLTQWLLPAIERTQNSIAYPGSLLRRPDVPHAAAAIWSLGVEKIAHQLTAVEALWWIANGVALGHFPSIRLREFELGYVYAVGARVRRTLESIDALESRWHSRRPRAVQRVISNDERQGSPVGVIASSPHHFVDWAASTLNVERHGRWAIRWDSMRSEMLMAQSLGDEPLIDTFLGGFLALGQPDVWGRLLNVCDKFATMPGVLNAVARRTRRPAAFDPDVFLAGFALMVEHMATATYVTGRETDDPVRQVLRRQAILGRRSRLDLKSGEAREQFLALGRVFHRLRRKGKVFPFEFDLDRIIEGWVGGPDTPSGPAAEPQYERTN